MAQFTDDRAPSRGAVYVSRFADGIMVDARYLFMPALALFGFIGFMTFDVWVGFESLRQGISRDPSRIIDVMAGVMSLCLSAANMAILSVLWYRGDISWLKLPVRMFLVICAAALFACDAIVDGASVTARQYGVNPITSHSWIPSQANWWWWTQQAVTFLLASCNEVFMFLIEEGRRRHKKTMGYDQPMVSVQGDTVIINGDATEHIRSAA